MLAELQPEPVALIKGEPKRVQIESTSKKAPLVFVLDGAPGGTSPDSGHSRPPAPSVHVHEPCQLQTNALRTAPRVRVAKTGCFASGQPLGLANQAAILADRAVSAGA